MWEPWAGLVGERQPNGRLAVLPSYLIRPQGGTRADRHFGSERSGEQSGNARLDIALQCALAAC